MTTTDGKDKPPWRPWGDHPVVVILVVIVSAIAILSFVTGKTSLRELLSGELTTPVNAPQVAATERPSEGVPTSSIPTTVIASTVTVPTTTAISGMYSIQIQDVNLRVNPSSDGESVAVLHRGQRVLVEEQSQLVAGNTWVLVRKDGVSGWVNQRYLRVVASEEKDIPRAKVINVAPNPLRVRSEPSVNAQIVDRLSEGSEVYVMERQQSDGVQWQRIQVDMTEGWVDVTFLESIQ